MAKYLDENGLLYFWGKIKSWVTNQGYTKNTGTITSVTTTAGAHTAINVSSGGVSFKVPTQTSHLTNNSNFVSDANYVHTDNNYTDAEKTKLAGIAAGAEVNVLKGIASPAGSNGITIDTDVNSNIFASVLTGTIVSSGLGSDYFITGKTAYDALALKANLASPTFTGTPKAPTATAGTNTTQIATTAFVTSAVSAAVAGEVVKSVDTTAGTSGINLSLSSAGKLDVTISSGSIASGNSNFVTGGTVYSTTSTLAPKASPALTGTPTAPTASEGTSTTQIATTAFVSTAIATAIGSITGIDFQIVQTLPASGEKGVIYLVPNSGSSPNSYDEYIWIVPTGGTGKFEKIGTTDIDLSGYLQISSYITNAEIDAIVAN